MGTNTPKTRAGFLGALGITAGVLLAAAALLVYAADPYFHYHAPWFGLSAVQTEKEYQVPGALRHLDYDAVIVGSSVVENNDNAWYDEAFGVHTIKAVRSYGCIADLTWYLNLAFSSQHLKRVFFNLDAAAMILPPETTFESTDCPMYLYDDNPWNDAAYLLNSSVLFEKIPYMIAQTLSGYNGNLSYNWAEGKNFSEAGALSQYQRKREPAAMEAADAYADNVQGNIDLLLEQVKKHPDTQFTFFLPPYSALWWDSTERSGLTEVYLWSEQQVMEALLSCDNVEVYDFQNWDEVVTDLDSYMDPIHFSPDINHRICDEIAAGRHLVTQDNLAAVLEDTRAMQTNILTQQIPALEAGEAFVYEK